MGGHRCDHRSEWVITIETSDEKHQAIIRSAVASLAYRRFEQRGCTHGSDFDDWVAAGRQLLVDDFSGDTSAFRFDIERPSDPEVATILSFTTFSLVVLRSRSTQFSTVEKEPDVISVHVMPEEIDPSGVTVKSAHRLLRVRAPKKKR